MDGFGGDIGWVDFRKDVAKEGVYSGPLLGGASLALKIRAGSGSSPWFSFILPRSGENYLRVVS